MTPVAVHAVQTLEALVEPITVTASDPQTGAIMATDHIVCTLKPGRDSAPGRAGLAGGTKGFERFTEWVDEHAHEYGFDAIGQSISPHQYRRTFAVVAAWQPDGHVAVELQLKDTAEVAAAYYANRDRRWYDAYELAKAEALAARLAGYVADQTIPVLGGPAGPTFASTLGAANLVAQTAPGLDGPGRVDAQRQALLTVGGSHVCGDGWDCAGERRKARCLAVASHRPEPHASLAPQLTSGLCLDIGEGDGRACRNVIFDPAVHLAFWDVELAHLDVAAARCRRDQALLRERLALERVGVAATIAELEDLCRSAPLRLIQRFQAERLRLVARIADDNHAPGVAALYRPLLVAQDSRIDWLQLLATQETP